MGALSTYYNNSYSYPILTNSQINTFQQEELAFQQQTQDFSSSCLDENFFTQSPYFHSNETNPFDDQLLHSIFSPPNEDFLSYDEIFANDQGFNVNNDNIYPCAKRQKLSYDLKFEQEQQQQELLLKNSSNFLVDEFFANPFGSFEAEQFTDVVQCDKKKVNEEKTISPQSIAARERRRKITEKTQELGKLVPGGTKMNTAEMLTAAANYVKFLQAQVGMLKIMETFSKEEKEPPPSEEDLHKLVISPIVQEKLYCEEKCIVSKEIVTTMTNYDDVRSKPTILKGLKQLIGMKINENKPNQE